jgi:hypothetical protein
MLIIHGEDTATSYKKLTDLIESLRLQQVEVIIKDVSDLDPPP